MMNWNGFRRKRSWYNLNYYRSICRFTPGDRAHSIHYIGGCVGPRPGLDPVEYRKISSRESKQPGLLPAFTLVACSTYSSTLKMEATHSSEISIEFQRTTRRYIPEDSTVLFTTIAVTTSNPTLHFLYCQRTIFHFASRPCF
jgi:hypothetical protein